MQSVAFVDDEKSILDGLRRLLRGYRNQWQMHFFESGSALLAAVENTHFDIVISDMRMPEMSGAEMLLELKILSPDTVRLALSGFADSKMIVQGAHVIHQFFAKPCDADVIARSIQRVFAMRAQVTNTEVRCLLGEIDNLPSVPHALKNLLQLSEGNKVPGQKYSEIIAADLGLSTAVIKMVNSAFFGLGREVHSPQNAADILGAETINQLLKQQAAFSAFNGEPDTLEKIIEINRRSQKIGALARALAQSAELPEQTQNYCELAGIMTSLGELIICAYQKQFSTIAACGLESPQLAAYMLCLWGMPEEIVDAVYCYRAPQTDTQKTMSITTIIHFAWAAVMADNQGIAFNTEMPLLDTNHMGEVVKPQLQTKWLGTLNQLLNEEDNRNDSACIIC